MTTGKCMVHTEKISKIKLQLGLKPSPEITTLKDVLRTKHCPNLKRSPEND